jgi:hypothetical protein
MPRICRVGITLFALSLLLCRRNVIAQTTVPDAQSFNRTLSAAVLPEGVKPPVIDGDLNDLAWQSAAHATIFYDPQSGKPVSDQTVAYLTSDKKYLYVGFACTDSQPNGIVARETIRDAQLDNDDTVAIILDTFLSFKHEDRSVFMVNPLGTRNAQLGGGRAGKLEWQGDWDAATRRTPTGWTAEMRIPWGILSYPRTGRLTIGLNFRRVQPRTRIESQWSNLGPQGFQEREGRWLNVEAPSQGWKPRLSFLPYLLPTGQVGSGASSIRAGLDARYQPTPEITAVGTLNPDFASVEGAIESIAFSRSERFVPDKRPFFLEGRDYLNSGADYQLGNLFYSRRIEFVDVGLKTYGKITPQTTLGVLGTFAPGRENNLVAQLRRDFGPTTSASVSLLQRVKAGEDNTVAVFSPHSRWGKWSADGQVAKSLGPKASGLAWTGAGNLEDKNLFATLRYRDVGETFVDRLGLIEFNDYRGWSGFLDWGAEWRHGNLRNFEFSFFPTFDWHQDGRPFRRRAGIGLNVETRSDYRFGINVDGGKFDNDSDLTYGLSLGGGVSNRFRQWGLNLTTGTQAHKPYTAFGPTISLRFLKKLDVAVSTFFQNYQGVSQQHILTFNYEMSPFRSWGGRLVIQDANTNFYLSYRNAGRGGLDTYFILGDPNARRFAQRVMMKWVFAL